MAPCQNLVGNFVSSGGGCAPAYAPYIYIYTKRINILKGVRQGYAPGSWGSEFFQVKSPIWGPSAFGPMALGISDGGYTPEGSKLNSVRAKGYAPRGYAPSTKGQWL